MNTRAIALTARTFGAFLLIASVVAFTYTVPVALKGPCYYGCPAEPQTYAPYASSALWMGMVGLGMMWIGYSFLPIEDGAESTHLESVTTN